MLKPYALKAGDLIGIVAPSSPTTPDKVKQAQEQVEALGFRVKMGPSCFATHGYLAGSNELRADDLNQMFADPAIQGIICLRGGYGVPKILDKVDFELIKHNPKVFVGYSDITALHIGLNQLSNLVTFHGPMAASDMVGGFDEFSKDYLLRAITNPAPLGAVQNPAGVKVHCLVPGEARGIVVGGNLALITATMGTPYEIDTRDKILFLEDIGEEPYRVDRMLTQLLLAGKLADAAGIILGDWNDCEAREPERSLGLLQVFEEIVVPVGKPTIYDLQAGHCTPKVTLPFGVQVSMNASEGQVVVLDSAVS